LVLLASQAVPGLLVAVTAILSSNLAPWREQVIYLIGTGVILELVFVTAGLLMVRRLDKQGMLTEARAAVAAAEAEVAVGRERERADRVLGEQAVRFGAALGNMTQVLCIFDATDRVVVGNERMATMLGLPAKCIAPGMTIGEIQTLLVGASSMPRADRQTINNLITRLKKDGDTAGCVQDLVDGRSLAMHFVTMASDGWLITLEDVTEQRLVEVRIAHMAHHDALTGLANRVLFHERLEDAVARGGRGQRSALLYLDLDHFKAVNDTLGHPIGDALLREVTSRLCQQVRETDMVARLGGDEFAILQSPIAQLEDSKVLARRLIDAIGAPYDFDGNRVNIGTSVGIAIIPDDGGDADLLMKNADMALYRSKADGRGRYCFFAPEMEARMQARRTLDLDMRKGLTEGEFRIYYQPLMNMASRSISGFEALLRWVHPLRGLVSPADFIPLAEEIGFIVPLGDWVLRRACADAAGWPANLKVAVNLSPVQFGGKSLVEDVADALACSGLEPHRLELEITETAMLENTDVVLASLHRLRDLGVGIALDDFGTGYSSLSYLLRFPFAKVKIDRSFVNGLGKRGEHDTIVAAVVDLCSRLGMATTAEGVETTAQLLRLEALHCDEAQGYLFSKPHPADQVHATLKRLSQRQVEAIAG
jgi:diguanylate cyclase (GGDEF)-like protein